MHVHLSNRSRIHQSLAKVKDRVEHPGSLHHVALMQQLRKVVLTNGNGGLQDGLGVGAEELHAHAFEAADGRALQDHTVAFFRRAGGAALVLGEQGALFQLRHL